MLDASSVFSKEGCAAADTESGPSNLIPPGTTETGRTLPTRESHEHQGVYAAFMAHFESEKAKIIRDATSHQDSLEQVRGIQILSFARIVLSSMYATSSPKHFLSARLAGKDSPDMPNSPAVSRDPLVFHQLPAEASVTLARNEDWRQSICG